MVSLTAEAMARQWDSCCDMPTNMTGKGNSGIMGLLNILYHDEVLAFSVNNMHTAICYEVMKAVSNTVQKTTCFIILKYKLSGFCKTMS